MKKEITITVDAKLAKLLGEYRDAVASGRDAIFRDEYEEAAKHIDVRNDSANAIALWLEILIDERRGALQEAA